MTTKLTIELVQATCGDMCNKNYRNLEVLHQEVNVLDGKHRKSVRAALDHLKQVQDFEARNYLFCFLWDKSGNAWDIPVTMTCPRG